MHRIPLLTFWARAAAVPFRLRTTVQIHRYAAAPFHTTTTFSLATTTTSATTTTQSSSGSAAAPPPASSISEERRPETASDVQSTSKFGTLTFEDHRNAFSHKGSWELLRALLVLKACAFDLFVDKSYKLLTLGERLLGERLLGIAVSPFYRQFVTGNSEKELATTTAQLKTVGIQLMVAPMVETDLGEDMDGEAMYNRNLTRTLMLVGLSAKYSSSDSYPVCQTKFTAHLSADALVRISIWYENLDFESRIKAVKSIADAMKDSGEEGNPNSIKASAQLKLQGLSNQDKEELHRCLPRLYRIGDSCREQGVVLTVDAEYTYVNPSINLLCMAMMEVFNKEVPIIWNTYQGYLKNTSEWLKHDLEIARHLSTTFGIKLVRGAYLETERKRAQELDYPDPVNNTYEDTNNNYNTTRSTTPLLKIRNHHPLLHCYQRLYLQQHS
ncbi:hydroxyproline dehydrogenase-like isoform X2 [Oratosquilla oratoria]|uniref:hydroxyproline dehydrogenase-like isoform X2 n=1 Tax=Oratosquilla oratoria TaxID=337810 RepID=UPI003F7732C7